MDEWNSSTSSKPLSSLGAHLQHRHTGTGMPAILQIIRLERMVGARGKKSHTLQSRRSKKLPYTVVAQRAEGRRGGRRN